MKSGRKKILYNKIIENVRCSWVTKSSYYNCYYHARKIKFKLNFSWRYRVKNNNHKMITPRNVIKKWNNLAMNWVITVQVYRDESKNIYI